MRLLRLHRGQMFCALLFFSGLASLSGNASAQVNLVANGSFETGSFASWTEAGNSAFNGVQCPGAAFVPQGNCGAFFGPVGSLGGIQQTIATVPGWQYSISFAFSGDGGLPSQFLVGFGTQTLLSLTNASTATTGFQTFTFGALATGPSTLLTFNFRDDPGFMELDNVAVTAVPEPETYALMLAGIGALLGARRFRRRGPKSR